MRVVSSLADINFSIGRIHRSGPDLVIESSPESTIDTRVTITPLDARRSLCALLVSPSVWLFVLRLPIAARLAVKPLSNDDWERRRRRTGLNKPW